MHIAVIGSGISGLAAAYRLRQHAQVTLFESNNYFGGHTNTIDVDIDGYQFGVDTGFLVYNERTYPQLIALFTELGIESAKSDMSFSVKLTEPKLEWSGSNLSTVFAQRKNLLNGRFMHMLAELLRFNRIARKLAASYQDDKQTVGEFLDSQDFSTEFRQWYLLPMMACIWSCPSAQMLQFPLSTMLRFCSNHGLLQINHRPQWYTVKGGARAYVNKIVALLDDTRISTPVRGVERLHKERSVRVLTDSGSEVFDHVIFATHSDQTLQLLSDVTRREEVILGAVPYQANRAVLHTDTSALPESRRAWAAWNYEQGGVQEDQRVCLHYLINKLQPLPVAKPVIVSLNPIRPIAADKVLREIEYSHPVFDQAAIEAQTHVASLQGLQNCWYCGAWTGYGFHEDGLKSGYAVADQLLQTMRVASIKDGSFLDRYPAKQMQPEDSLAL